MFDGLKAHPVDETPIEVLVRLRAQNTPTPAWGPVTAGTGPQAPDGEVVPVPAHAGNGHHADSPAVLRGARTKTRLGTQLPALHPEQRTLPSVEAYGQLLTKDRRKRLPPHESS